MKLDVVRTEDGMVVKEGTKEFRPAEKPLNKWVKRPKGTQTTLPMSSALKVAKGRSVRCDRLAEGALGYIKYHSNDAYHNNLCYFVSGAAADGHGWSITPDNFEQSMVCLAARRLIPDTWLNHEDEYNQPDEQHSDYQQLVNDAVIYALFNGANQSSSITPVDYEGQQIELRNEFFPFTRHEFMTTTDLPLCVYQDAQAYGIDPFVSEWLHDRLVIEGQPGEPRQHFTAFSPDAQTVLDLGRLMFTQSVAVRMNADPQYQLGRWDAGWYQLRMGVYKRAKFELSKELKALQWEFERAYKLLAERLEKLIYELGMLPKAELLEEET